MFQLGKYMEHFKEKDKEELGLEQFYSVISFDAEQAAFEVLQFKAENRQRRSGN